MKGHNMNKVNMNNSRMQQTILATLLTTTIISGLVLSSSIVSADDVVDNVSITISQSCTMSGTGNNTHTATIDNGTYQANIGTTTMKVLCNDNAGFSIYAIGFTDNKYDGANHTKLVGTSASNNATIATGTNTSAGNDDISNWAMKLSTDTTATYPITIQSNYDSYSLVPDTYTKVATRLSGTDVGTNATGSTLTTTYAAYISKTQPADTYTGQVKYTLVHPNTEQPLQPQPATSGCINYFANASDAVGTMGCQSATDGQSKTLLASNFSRTGYGFAGWSDSFDYTTNSDAKFYGPNETITVPTGTTANGLSLYAVWIKSQGSIQDQSKVASVCSGLDVAPTDGTANLKSVSALTDQRDNNTYAIAKLADGNCWMIENLRLESTNSDNSTGNLAQGYGGQFAGLAVAEPAWASNITTANSLYSTNGANDTINIGTSDAGYRFPRYNNINTPTNTADRPQNPTINSATNSTSNASMYSYGNYYTWAAAIADTTSYSSGDHNTTSICPTGWQLPLGNTSTGDIEQGAADATNKVGGFSYLDRKMGGTGQNQSTTGDSLRWRKYPVNFVYSGGVSSGSVSVRGSYGYFWSSTARSSNYAYSLYLDSSDVYPGTYYSNNKYLGRTVRCVAPGV